MVYFIKIANIIKYNIYYFTSKKIIIKGLNYEKNVKKNISGKNKIFNAYVISVIQAVNHIIL